MLEASLGEWFPKADTSTEAMYKLCEKHCVSSAHFPASVM